MQLRLAFQTIKKASLTMMEYILKLKNIADNLAAIGETVSERDHVLQLLAGLGSEYDPIVASLTAREDDVPLLLFTAFSSLMNNIWSPIVQF